MRNVDYVVDIVSNAFTPYQWLAILIVASIVTATAMLFLDRKRDELGATFILGLLIPPAVWAIALTVLHFISFLQWLWLTPPLAP